MKKKILALAISGALVSPTALAAQDTSGMQYTSAAEGFYASLRIVLDSGSSVGSDSGLASNFSRIGVRGTNDLGGGLSGFYQWEAEVFADGDTSADGSGSNNSGIRRTRVAHVGLRGGFGELMVGGGWPNSYNWTYGSTDVANNYSAYAIGNLSVPYRSSKSIQYTTPDLNGFQAAFNVEMDGDRNPHGTGDDDQSRGVDANSNDLDSWQLSGVYNVQGFTIGATYGRTTDGNALRSVIADERVDTRPRLSSGSYHPGTSPVMSDLPSNRNPRGSEGVTDRVLNLPNPLPTPVDGISTVPLSEGTTPVIQLDADGNPVQVTREVNSDIDTVNEDIELPGTTFMSTDDNDVWVIRGGYAQDNWYVNAWYGKDNSSERKTFRRQYVNGRVLPATEAVDAVVDDPATTDVNEAMAAVPAMPALPVADIPANANHARIPEGQTLAQQPLGEAQLVDAVDTKHEDVEIFSLAGGVSVDKVNVYAVYENVDNAGGVSGIKDTYTTLGVQYNLGAQSRVWVEYFSQDRDDRGAADDSSRREDDSISIGLRHDF